MTEEELDLFELALPRLEAYYELLNRRVHSQITEDRARLLTFLVTEDEQEADLAAGEVKFATTPYEP